MDNHISDLYKPNLHTHKLIPENQETPIHFQNTWITPTEYFYRRNHFPYPDLSNEAFYIPIIGEVERPMTFPYNYLKTLPSKEITMVLECSGNKRDYFRPKTYGEQWRDGAIGQGVWKGVSLKDLLNITGIKNTAKEVVFKGYDNGQRTDMNGVFYYLRSLPIDIALHPDTIIAYELNGETIPYGHGYPLRLIVPHWYGMASVKWLKEISVIDHKFEGPFQTVDYVYYPYKKDNSDARPVTNIKVDSIIQQPINYSILDTGVHQICGLAWTGHGVIKEVEISFDNGVTWHKTEQYQDRRQPYSWTSWKYIWEAKEKGEYKIMSRAKDSEGNIQPLEGEWNRKGYGYNAAYSISVKVE